MIPAITPLLNQELTKAEQPSLTHRLNLQEGDDRVRGRAEGLRSESDSSDNGNLDTTHKHAIKGRKRLKLCNGLQVGEKVLLLRWQGGQKYLVLDRVSEAVTKGEW